MRGKGWTQTPEWTQETGEIAASKERDANTTVIAGSGGESPVMPSKNAQQQCLKATEQIFSTQRTRAYKERVKKSTSFKYAGE